MTKHVEILIISKRIFVIMWFIYRHILSGKFYITYPTLSSYLQQLNKQLKQLHSAPNVTFLAILKIRVNNFLTTVHIDKTPRMITWSNFYKVKQSYKHDHTKHISINFYNIDTYIYLYPVFIIFIHIFSASMIHQSSLLIFFLCITDSSIYNN